MQLETKKVLTWVGIAVVVLFALGYWATAKAADKGGPNFLDIPGSNPKSSWTGCGVGIYGSFLNADTDTPTVNVGSNGNEAGAKVLCDVAMGSFVIGAGLEYGRVFGDLHALGVDASMGGYMRGGVLVSQGTMVYALIARNRLDTSAGNLDGWQFGGGVETKLPSAPLFLSLEYRHGIYDLSDIGGPALDANMDVVRLGVAYKFGGN